MRDKPTGGADASLFLPVERIVAAGIEHQHRRRGALLAEPRRKVVGEEGFVLDDFFLARRRFRNIDRQQVVAAIDGEAVAGIEHDDDVVLFDAVFEFDDGAAHRPAADVFGLHHLEAERLQPRRHRARVVAGFGEIGDVVIAVVADDEGDAAGVRASAVTSGQQQGQRRKRR